MLISPAAKIDRHRRDGNGNRMWAWFASSRRRDARPRNYADTLSYRHTYCLVQYSTYVAMGDDSTISRPTAAAASSPPTDDVSAHGGAWTMAARMPASGRRCRPACYRTGGSLPWRHWPGRRAWATTGHGGHGPILLEGFPCCIRNKAPSLPM